MLLALAHKWEGMVRRGEVKDYGEIARLHRLSRARVSQIAALALLPPSVQEALLVGGGYPSSRRRFSMPLWSDHIFDR